MLIQVQDLGYTYVPGTPLARSALRGVTLDIRAGERIGIAGPSGSGKSTLVQLLAGLLEPTLGRVSLDGVLAHERSATARARRGRIGVAFQQPEDQIFEQTVVREVAFGPRNLGLDAAETAVRVRWALDLVGLVSTEMEERVPFTLSGGEMRRVALASILAMRPDVLILDEPTAGLDPRGRRDLLSRIHAWQAETGLTLIVVSHHLDELAQLVDRVLLLEGGRLVADGPTRQVLSDGRLLRSVGLDVPHSVALLEALQGGGWPVRTDHLLLAEAVAEIAEASRLRESPLPSPSGGGVGGGGPLPSPSGGGVGGGGPLPSPSGGGAPAAGGGGGGGGGPPPRLSPLPLGVGVAACEPTTARHVRIGRFNPAPT
jgi:energy-coupling factor transport system ATP-binding protein